MLNENSCYQHGCFEYLQLISKLATYRVYTILPRNAELDWDCAGTTFDLANGEPNNELKSSISDWTLFCQLHQAGSAFLFKTAKSIQIGLDSSKLLKSTAFFLAQYFVGGLVACFMHWDALGHCACWSFLATQLWFLCRILISVHAHCPFWPCPGPFGIHNKGLACAFCALSSPRAKHVEGFWCSHLRPFPSLQWIVMNVMMHFCQVLASHGTWLGSLDQGHSCYFLGYPSSLLFWIRWCWLCS